LPDEEVSLVNDEIAIPFGLFTSDCDPVEDIDVRSDEIDGGIVALRSDGRPRRLCTPEPDGSSWPLRTMTRGPASRPTTWSTGW
jgi:hypothetical protein